MDLRAGYDIVVAGGGSAGIVAAIQGGRAGRRTLLVEKNGVLGGTIVAGGVNFPASFHAYGEQVNAGIGWELCCRARGEEGRPAPVPGPDDSPVAGCHHFGVNRALFAAVADELVIEAGADLLLHAMPAAVRREGGDWRVTLCTKTGLREVAARVLIDCTGDANVVSLAGFEVRRNAELQAATLVVRIGGYDPAALDYAAIQAAFDREVAAGTLKRSDAGWFQGAIDRFLRGRGGNCLHVAGVDARTSEEKTGAELEARRVLLRLYRFLRRQPGLGGLVIEDMAVECGIRETVTIRGRTEIAIGDYERGHVYPDAICYSFYPVDSHRPDHLVYRALARGVVPTIPFGALVPEGSVNLLAAGRCAAGDGESNSSYRVQASCMAMGQAVAAAAALGVELGVPAADVPLDALRAMLRRHGAMVPPAAGTGGG